MTLAIISSRFPRPGSETFLGTELKGLRRHFKQIVVLPVRESLFTPATLRAALAELRANPKGVAQVAATLFAGAGRPSIFFKNLIILPKALAIAQTVRRRRVDHIHAYWLSTPATVAYIASRLTGVPWSSSAHRWDIYENNLLKHKARSARFLRTISDRGRRDLGSALESPDAAKVSCIKLGVEMPQIDARHDSAHFSILCAANLIEQKGHAVLLDALAILAGRGIAFRCDIAGSGPLYAALQRRIAALRLQHQVFLCGRVGHDELLERLRRGDYQLAVLASRSDGRRNMEGIPVALIEAMAAGVPCVATSSGSIPELIDDGCGAVVPVDDAAALAAALQRLAACADKRRRLGRNARARVAEEFNLERTAPALAEMILAS